MQKRFFLTKYDPDTKTTGHTQNKWVQLSMDSKSAFSCLMEIHIFITTTIENFEIFSYNVAENCFFFFLDSWAVGNNLQRDFSKCSCAKARGNWCNPNWFSIISRLKFPELAPKLNVVCMYVFFYKSWLPYLKK